MTMFQKKDLESDDVNIVKAKARSFIGNGLTYMEGQVPAMKKYLEYLNGLLKGTEMSYRNEQEQ